MLAINRTDKVKGRIRILKVSIKTRIGAKTIGDPLGTKCAIVSFNDQQNPLERMTPQEIKASSAATHRLVVTL